MLQLHTQQELAANSLVKCTRAVRALELPVNMQIRLRVVLVVHQGFSVLKFVISILPGAHVQIVTTFTCVRNKISFQTLM